LLNRLITVIIAILLSICGTGCDRKLVSQLSIGAVLPLSGAEAESGQAAVNAIKMAVDELNAAGGLNGETLSLIVYDNEGDTAKSYLAVNKLAEKDRVVGIIGPLDENAAIAITPLIDEMALPLISLSGECVPPRQSSPYVYRLKPSPARLAEKLAEMLETENIEKAALIYYDDECGEIGRTELADKQQANIDWVAVEKFDSLPESLGRALGKVTASRPDVAVLWAPAKAASKFVPFIAGRNLAFPTYLLPSTGAVTPEALAIAQQQTIATLQPQIAHYGKLTREELRASKIRQFAEQYEKTFNSAPVETSFWAFDAAKMMIDALSAVGTEREAVRKHLHSLNNYRGLAGHYSFSLKKTFGLNTGSLVRVYNIDGHFEPLRKTEEQQ
jgi:branched-chain amino acid transport system substrate-binding protein